MEKLNGFSGNFFNFNGDCYMRVNAGDGVILWLIADEKAGWVDVGFEDDDHEALENEYIKSMGGV